MQPSDGHVPRLAVGLAFIQPDQGTVEVEAGYRLKRQTPIADVALVLGGIEGDVYSDCMYDLMA